MSNRDEHPIEHVVAAAAAGDAFAWSLLTRRFGGVMGAAARAHRLSEQDAQDVSQTTWLRLVENIDGLRSPDAIGSWLWITAQRESLRVLRARGRELPSDELHDAPAPAEDDTAERRRSAVRRAIGKLPPPRQALAEALVSDMSYDEISGRLGIPVGSIGPTRARIVDRLRRDTDVRLLALSA